MGAARGVRVGSAGSGWSCARPRHHAALLEAKLRTSPAVPVFLSLAVGGLLPVRLSRPYLPSTEALLLTTAPYCAVVMTVVLYSTSSVLLRHLPSVMEAKVFMQLYTRLTCVNAVLTITPILLVPVMWAGCRGLVARAVDFCNYEITHERLTGRRLEWSRHVRRNQVVIALFYATLVIVFFVSNKIVQPETAQHVPSYACSLHFQSHMSLWYITWICQIHFAAKDVLRYLAESAEHPCVLVRRARRLWVELRELLEKNKTLRALIFLICGYLFFVITLSLYQVIHYGHRGEMGAALAQAVILVTMSFQIYLFCNETHKCITSMNKAFITALDRFSLRAEDDETRKVINLFYLSIASNPSKSSLAGFATCDRALLTSMVSAMMTYLVVLVQFQTIQTGADGTTPPPAFVIATPQTDE